VAPASLLDVALRRPAVGRDAERALTHAARMEGSFWEHLVAEPLVARFLRRALISKVRRDAAFADRVTAAAIVADVALSASSSSSDFAKRRRLGSLRNGRLTARGADWGEPDAGMRACRGPFLSSLGLELSTLVLSFVELRTKVLGLRSASRGLRQVMEARDACDPLFLDRETGRLLLRLLKQRAPRCQLPGGIFKVQQLTVELMDAERLQDHESDTED